MNMKFKSLFAGAFALASVMAGAATMVTVNSVQTGEPWSNITIGYTLAEVDSDLTYKVAFDITAQGVTKSVTNAAEKLESKAYTKEIDTAALFGTATTDIKAKVKVSLIAVKSQETQPEQPSQGVQLWANGPFWAESNIGATTPEGYGDFFTFEDATTAVDAELGTGWRVPTAEDFADLLSQCDKSEDILNGIEGVRFTGKGDYASNSIFLPYAGCAWEYDPNSGWSDEVGEGGFYWSSTLDPSWGASYFTLDYIFVEDLDCGMSVRAVR